MQTQTQTKTETPAQGQRFFGAWHCFADGPGADRGLVRRRATNLPALSHRAEPGGKPASPTQFGQSLQRLPLDPNVGNLVMNGVRQGTLDDCGMFAAVYQRGDMFFEFPQGRRRRGALAG